MKHTHKGEAMTVVVVILAIALVGALGFIAWQNFHTSTEPTEKTNDTTVSQEKTVDHEKTVVFRDWGVEWPLGDSVPKVSVERLDDIDGYALSIPESELFDGKDRGDATQELGRITRVAATTPASEAMLGGDANKTIAQAIKDGDLTDAVVVGEYAYMYAHRQNTAFVSETSGPDEQAADKKLETLSATTLPGQLSKLRS